MNNRKNIKHNNHKDTAARYKLYVILYSYAYKQQSGIMYSKFRSTIFCTVGGTMKRRTLIRILTFAAFAFAVMLARNIMLMREKNASLTSIRNNYTHAIEELSTAADNISNTLQKELCAGTADMHQKLSQQLWRDSSTAKAALSQLPAEAMRLENTNKFLSQVGNYSLAVSEKLREGGTLSGEEYEKLSKLYEFSKQLCSDMWALESKAANGELPLGEAPAAGSKGDPPTVTDGFEDFEEGFDSYPTLVYDGPFSDHIMEKKPLMTEGKAEISREKAHQRAAAVLGVSDKTLSETLEEDGKMPSYVFSDSGGTAVCAVTKQGGYVSYLLKSRDVVTENITADQALKAAADFLDSLGIDNMQKTYYEDLDRIMTVNYAYRDGDICCYTDLIKVSVAMDTGEIIGYDARGYLVNHRSRSFDDERKSILDIQKKVSPQLKILSRGTALIPSDSQEELLCYEFKCETKDGTHVLVYFNAVTGKEEQILILYESESGTLTM